MTRKQHEREELTRERDRQLDLLAQVEANADPCELSIWAGFWLERQAPEGQRYSDRTA